MLMSSRSNSFAARDTWGSLGPARFLGQAKRVGEGLTSDEVKRLDNPFGDIGDKIADGFGKVGDAASTTIEDILHPKPPKKDAPPPPPDHTMTFVVAAVAIVGIVAAVYYVKG